MGRIDCDAKTSINKIKEIKMIPNIIHYIWLGKNKLNNTSLICINSWKRILPEYEIKLWNEDNLNLGQLMRENNFLKKCIECGLWAFASDYLRLYILYKEGGVYMDTDVEVIRSFGNLMREHFFIGLEKDDYVGTGIIGAEICSPAIKRLLDFYDSEIWNVNYYNNPIIFKYLMKREPRIFKNCKVLPIEYFSPYDPYNLPNGVIGTENTICIHWYNASWGMSRKGYVFLETKHQKNPGIKLYQIIRKNIGYFRRKDSLNK